MIDAAKIKRVILDMTCVIEQLTANGFAVLFIDGEARFQMPPREYPRDMRFAWTTDAN